MLSGKARPGSAGFGISIIRSRPALPWPKCYGSGSFSFIFPHNRITPLLFVPSEKRA